MKVNEYLTRIGASGKMFPDFETLAFLQQQHLLNVPFENLDIHWERPIILDTDRFYSKIVDEKRGGYCYELNGLFNELLTALGYRTHLVSGKVYGGERGYGPEFDHMAIVVMIGSEEYLADVGFGDFSVAPLRIDLYEEQIDREGTFIVRPTEHGEFEIEKQKDGQWVPELLFTRNARNLREFAERNEFQQHSPDSHFRRKKICSVLTNDGRKTLTSSSFINTDGGGRTEVPIANDKEFIEKLKNEFGFALTNGEFPYV